MRFYFQDDRFIICTKNGTLKMIKSSNMSLIEKLINFIEFDYSNESISKIIPIFGQYLLTLSGNLRYFLKNFLSK